MCWEKGEFRILYDNAKVMGLVEVSVLVPFLSRSKTVTLALLISLRGCLERFRTGFVARTFSSVWKITFYCVGVRAESKMLL